MLYHRHEERILAQCDTAEQTDAAYCRRCIPAKARLDLIYQRNQSVCFDIKLIWQTAARVLR
jgi:lipopolysaccharide/colanic/teichoic acid biosynthesis glycosyltransferase